VPGFEKVYIVLSRLDHDLRDEMLVLVLGEQRLDAVRLGTDAVDQADVGAVRVGVDVVPSGESVAGGERGREQHAIRAFNRHEVFADDEGRRAVVVQEVVELVQIGHRSDSC
jgi:hypothetical protein